MAESRPLILGEFRRALDERFRLSVPTELLELLTRQSPDNDDHVDCALVKERPGCLSLWRSAHWRERLQGAIGVVETKWQAGRLETRLHDVQSLGRLLSTRHRDVQLAGRGRLVIPEGFREFLGVEGGGEAVVVGAGVCVEIWRPTEWISHLNEQMPEFSKLLEDLSA